MVVYLRAKEEGSHAATFEYMLVTDMLQHVMPQHVSKS